MDLSNSVILPREDFFELQAAASEPSPQSFGQKMGSSVATSTFVVVTGATFVGASWGWAKAMDWLDGRRNERKYRKPETNGS
jgi:hypothetical protein